MPSTLDTPPGPDSTGVPGSTAAQASPGAPSLAGELRRLRAVAAVCAQGSVARAGEVLHLSQPAVTRAVRELESIVGVPLFERAARGMVPTRAGRLVGRRVERAIAELAGGALDALSLSATPHRAAQAQRPQRFAAAVAWRSLESFVAIERSGSEPRAARELGISQPAVNRNLRELERLAGVPLLQRTTRGTRLTPAGELLLRRVKLALAELRNAEDELASFTGRLHGRVVLGTLPLSASYLAPHAVERLLASHADLQVTVVDGTYDALVEKLRCAEVDVIVGALRTELAADLAQEPLFEDTLTVVARAGHRCARDASALTLSALVGEPWIVPLPGTPARAAFERAFATQGLAPPRAALQTNSAAVVRSMLTETDRLALLSPRQVVSELRNGLLVTLPVDVGVPARTIGMTTRRDGAPSPGAAALLQALREASACVRADG
jgi:LysR family transcriptional regulator of gallate degradation